MLDISLFIADLCNIFSFSLVQFIVTHCGFSYCYVYIGAILFLHWNNSNCIYSMLLASVVGSVYDIMEHYSGIHTFALVLLAYVRHYMLCILIPMYKNEKYVNITSANIGIAKILFMSLITIIIYYAVVCLLNSSKYFIIHYQILLMNMGICVVILSLCNFFMSIIENVNNR